MKFKEYSTISKSTLERDFNLMFLAVAAAGELGETCNFIKKQERDNQDFKKEILLEIGDTLYYLARICEKLDSSLEEVALLNLEKLGL